jgi:hypothetical protein
MQAGHVANEPSEREQALRTLPLAYSLALRLRDVGVAPEVICEYVGIEEAAMQGVYRIAEAKLLAARELLTRMAGSTADLRTATR